MELYFEPHLYLEKKATDTNYNLRIITPCKRFRNVGNRIIFQPGGGNTFVLLSVEQNVLQFSDTYYDQEEFSFAIPPDTIFVYVFEGGLPVFDPTNPPPGGAVSWKEFFDTVSNRKGRAVVHDNDHDDKPNQ